MFSLVLTVKFSPNHHTNFTMELFPPSFDRDVLAMVHCASLFAPDGDGSLDKNGNITKIGTQIWTHNMEDAARLSGAWILVAV
jgi:hypothetical protein